MTGSCAHARKSFRVLAELRAPSLRAQTVWHVAHTASMSRRALWHHIIPARTNAAADPRADASADPSADAGAVHRRSDADLSARAPTPALSMPLSRAPTMSQTASEHAAENDMRENSSRSRGRREMS